METGSRLFMNPHPAPLKKVKRQLYFTPWKASSWWWS